MRENPNKYKDGGMKRANCFLSRLKLKRNPSFSFQTASLTRAKVRFWSSESESNLSQTQNVEDVSNEELKRRIEKYLKGDGEALPSIFEAILMRKLTGKHDDSDSELMEEIKHKSLGHVKDEEE